jgi:hypothetical protein
MQFSFHGFVLQFNVIFIIGRIQCRIIGWQYPICIGLIILYSLDLEEYSPLHPCTSGLASLLAEVCSNYLASHSGKRKQSI